MHFLDVVKGALQVLSHNGGNEVYLKTPVYVEIIPPGVELEFNITLDEGILADFSTRTESKLPFKSLEDVIAMVNDFAAAIWQFERDFWDNVSGNESAEMKDFYVQSPAGMRLGWGSGLSGTGLLMLLPRELRREVRDTLFEPRGRFEFPKSRRAVMEGNIPRQPLGWVNLDIV